MKMSEEGKLDLPNAYAPQRCKDAKMFNWQSHVIATIQMSYEDEISSQFVMLQMEWTHSPAVGLLDYATVANLFKNP